MVKNTQGAMLHELKTTQPHFSDILTGKKKFEVRRNDRDFQTGHVLALREWDSIDESYTGRAVIARIEHILDEHEGLLPGFVVMSIFVFKGSVARDG